MSRVQPPGKRRGSRQPCVDYIMSLFQENPIIPFPPPPKDAAGTWENCWPAGLFVRSTFENQTSASVVVKQ